MPSFSDAKVSDLSWNVAKFTTGLELLKTIAQNIDPADLIKCIKQRLSGEAFIKANQRKFSIIDEIGEFIKKEFKKRRNLEMVRSDIEKAVEHSCEKASEFGRRIELLLNEAEGMLKASWKESKAVSANCEYRIMAKNKFIWE